MMNTGKEIIVVPSNLMVGTFEPIKEVVNNIAE
jgi:hypothetical protein